MSESFLKEISQFSLNKSSTIMSEPRSIMRSYILSKAYARGDLGGAGGDGARGERQEQSPHFSRGKEKADGSRTRFKGIIRNIEQ
jgi:hypothetical protein